MTRVGIYEKLTDESCDLFDNEDIKNKDVTVADDIEGWHSLIHITLIGVIEESILLL